MSKKFIFTFGSGQPLQGYCQVVYAEDEMKAREIMVENYGTKWAFQYSEEEWNEVPDWIKEEELINILK